MESKYLLLYAVALLLYRGFTNGPMCGVEAKSMAGTNKGYGIMGTIDEEDSEEWGKEQDKMFHKQQADNIAAGSGSGAGSGFARETITGQSSLLDRQISSFKSPAPVLIPEINTDVKASTRIPQTEAQTERIAKEATDEIVEVNTTDPPKSMPTTDPTGQMHLALAVAEKNRKEIDELQSGVRPNQYNQTSMPAQNTTTNQSPGLAPNQNPIGAQNPPQRLDTTGSQTPSFNSMYDQTQTLGQTNVVPVQTPAEPNVQASSQATHPGSNTVATSSETNGNRAQSTSTAEIGPAGVAGTVMNTYKVSVPSPGQMTDTKLGNNGAHVQVLSTNNAYGKTDANGTYVNPLYTPSNTIAVEQGKNAMNITQRPSNDNQKQQSQNNVSSDYSQTGYHWNYPTTSQQSNVGNNGYNISSSTSIYQPQGGSQGSSGYNYQYATTWPAYPTKPPTQSTTKAQTQRSGNYQWPSPTTGRYGTTTWPYYTTKSGWQPVGAAGQPNGFPTAITGSQKPTYPSSSMHIQGPIQQTQASPGAGPVISSPPGGKIVIFSNSTILLGGVIPILTPEAREGGPSVPGAYQVSNTTNGGNGQTDNSQSPYNQQAPYQVNQPISLQQLPSQVSQQSNQGQTGSSQTSNHANQYTNPQIAQQPSYNQEVVTNVNQRADQGASSQPSNVSSNYIKPTTSSWLPTYSLMKNLSQTLHNNAKGAEQLAGSTINITTQIFAPNPGNSVLQNAKHKPNKALLVPLADEEPLESTEKPTASAPTFQFAAPSGATGSSPTVIGTAEKEMVSPTMATPTGEPEATQSMADVTSPTDSVSEEESIGPQDEHTPTSRPTVFRLLDTDPLSIEATTTQELERNNEKEEDDLEDNGYDENSDEPKPIPVQYEEDKSEKTAPTETPPTTAMSTPDPYQGVKDAILSVDISQLRPGQFLRLRLPNSQRSDIFKVKDIKTKNTKEIAAYTSDLNVENLRPDKKELLYAIIEKVRKNKNYAKALKTIFSMGTGRTNIETPKLILKSSHKHAKIIDLPKTDEKKHYTAEELDRRDEEALSKLLQENIESVMGSGFKGIKSMTSPYMDYEDIRQNIAKGLFGDFSKEHGVHKKATIGRQRSHLAERKTDVSGTKKAHGTFEMTLKNEEEKKEKKDSDNAKDEDDDPLFKDNKEVVIKGKFKTKKSEKDKSEEESSEKKPKSGNTLKNEAQGSNGNGVGNGQMPSEGGNANNQGNVNTQENANNQGNTNNQGVNGNNQAENGDNQPGNGNSQGTGNTANGQTQMGQQGGGAGNGDGINQGPIAQNVNNGNVGNQGLQQNGNSDGAGNSNGNGNTQQGSGDMNNGNNQQMLQSGNTENNNMQSQQQLQGNQNSQTSSKLKDNKKMTNVIIEDDKGHTIFKGPLDVAKLNKTVSGNSGNKGTSLAYHLERTGYRVEAGENSEEVAIIDKSLRQALVPVKKARLGRAGRHRGKQGHKSRKKRSISPEGEITEAASKKSKGSFEFEINLGRKKEKKKESDDDGNEEDESKLEDKKKVLKYEEKFKVKNKKMKYDTSEEEEESESNTKGKGRSSKKDTNDVVIKDNAGRILYNGPLDMAGIHKSKESKAKSGRNYMKSLEEEFSSNRNVVIKDNAGRILYNGPLNMSGIQKAKYSNAKSGRKYMKSSEQEYSSDRNVLHDALKKIGAIRRSKITKANQTSNAFKRTQGKLILELKMPGKEKDSQKGDEEVPDSETAMGDDEGTIKLTGSIKEIKKMKKTKNKEDEDENEEDEDEEDKNKKKKKRKKKKKKGKKGNEESKKENEGEDDKKEKENEDVKENKNKETENEESEEANQDNKKKKKKGKMEGDGDGDDEEEEEEEEKKEEKGKKKKKKKKTEKEEGEGEEDERRGENAPNGKVTDVVIEDGNGNTLFKGPVDMSALNQTIANSKKASPSDHKTEENASNDYQPFPRNEHQTSAHTNPDEWAALDQSMQSYFPGADDILFDGGTGERVRRSIDVIPMSNPVGFVENGLPNDVPGAKKASGTFKVDVELKSKKEKEGDSDESNAPHISHLSFSTIQNDEDKKKIEFLGNLKYAKSKEENENEGENGKKKKKKKGEEEEGEEKKKKKEGEDEDGDKNKKETKKKEEEEEEKEEEKEGEKEKEKEEENEKEKEEKEDGKKKKKKRKKKKKEEEDEDEDEEKEKKDKKEKEGEEEEKVNNEEENEDKDKKNEKKKKKKKKKGKEEDNEDEDGDEDEDDDEDDEEKKKHMHSMRLQDTNKNKGGTNVIIEDEKGNTLYQGPVDILALNKTILSRKGATQYQLENQGYKIIRETNQQQESNSQKYQSGIPNTTAQNGKLSENANNIPGSISIDNKRKEQDAQHFIVNIATEDNNSYKSSNSEKLAPEPQHLDKPNSMATGGKSQQGNEGNALNSLRASDVFNGKGELETTLNHLASTITAEQNAKAAQPPRVFNTKMDKGNITVGGQIVQPSTTLIVTTPEENKGREGKPHVLHDEPKQEDSTSVTSKEQPPKEKPKTDDHMPHLGEPSKPEKAARPGGGVRLYEVLKLTRPNLNKMPTSETGAKTDGNDMSRLSATASSEKLLGEPSVQPLRHIPKFASEQSQGMQKRNNSEIEDTDKPMTFAISGPFIDQMEKIRGQDQKMPALSSIYNDNPPSSEPLSKAMNQENVGSLSALSPVINQERNFTVALESQERQPLGQTPLPLNGKLLIAPNTQQLQPQEAQNPQVVQFQTPQGAPGIKIMIRRPDGEGQAVLVQSKNASPLQLSSGTTGGSEGAPVVSLLNGPEQRMNCHAVPGANGLSMLNCGPREQLQQIEEVKSPRLSVLPKTFASQPIVEQSSRQFDPQSMLDNIMGVPGMMNSNFNSQTSKDARQGVTPESYSTADPATMHKMNDDIKQYLNKEMTDEKNMIQDLLIGSGTPRATLPDPRDSMESVIPFGFQYLPGGQEQRLYNIEHSNSLYNNLENKKTASYFGHPRFPHHSMPHHLLHSLGHPNNKRLYSRSTTWRPVFPVFGIEFTPWHLRGAFTRSGPWKARKRRPEPWQFSPFRAMIIGPRFLLPPFLRPTPCPMKEEDSRACKKSKSDDKKEECSRQRSMGEWEYLGRVLCSCPCLIECMDW